MPIPDTLGTGKPTSSKADLIGKATCANIG